MDKKYYLFGVEVDKATYDKYADRKYPFMGSKNGIGVEVLRLYATDSSIAKDLPEAHREARRIVDQIKAELTGSGKPTGFKVFLAELDAAHKEAAAEFKRIHGAMDIANQEYERAQKDTAAPPYMMDIAKGDLARAKMEYEQNKNRPAEIIQEKSKEIRARMEAYVSKVYRANPEAVDESTMRLLESGIVTADELGSLSERFRDNTTMLRLMAAHAKKEARKFMDGGDRDSSAKWTAQAHYLSKAVDSSGAMAGFDALVDQSVRSMTFRAGVYPSEGIRGKLWDDAYAATVEAYNSFVIQPTEAVE